jgi:LmbE family N-acetylglucosaminyl deacetylase
MEDWYTPYQARPLPSAQRVLIFAPHPDDEIFGCGGAACLYQEQGSEVKTVVLTDGAANAPASERPLIFATRQAETNAALAQLNIPPAIFWGLPDRGISASPGLPARMAELLETETYGVVFTPSLSEIHPDHKACTYALLAALELRQSKGKTLPTVMFYEVGIPLSPNCLIDITPVWPRKKQAMQSFVSQQASQDYARQVEGLNTYRTYTLGLNIQQAEAYRLLTADALWEETAGLSTAENNSTRAHWLQSVLAAAETAHEALLSQIVAQNRLVADMEASARTEREKLWQKMTQTSVEFNKQLTQINLARQNLQWQVDHQSQEIQSLKHHISQQKTQLDERADQLNALRWTTDHQATENTQLQQEILQTQKRLQNCQTELALMTKTLWWRIGKPLRWALHQLKLRKA